MESDDWLEHDYADQIELIEHKAKKKAKQRKRKWREIEAIKEQQRLKRELEFFQE
ncbi:DUF3545 family protein [Litorilituus lipolyticus]|uniref:DUF3545 family protein n=2 Tax=Litorilituus lipolyticus TaxID=2491017 RepID=A0A502KXS5_9GAMM|nr:DUF3545 family protein [Litorilituus lipolyticus]